MNLIYVYMEHNHMSQINEKLEDLEMAVCGLEEMIRLFKTDFEQFRDDMQQHIKYITDSLRAEHGERIDLESKIKLSREESKKSLTMSDVTGDGYAFRKFYLPSAKYLLPLKEINNQYIEYWHNGDWVRDGKRKVAEKIAKNLAACYTAFNSINKSDMNRTDFIKNQNRVTQLLQNREYQNKLLTYILQSAM